MKIFWTGLCITAILVAGCGPTPVSRDRQQANAEHFDLAEADRLLGREAPPDPEDEAGPDAPAQKSLVVNEGVRLLPEGSPEVVEESSEVLAPDRDPLPDEPTDEDIQTALKEIGYYQGAIDGKIGPLTLAAIKKFQEEKDLKVDGKVGPQTWGALREALNDT